MNLRKASWDRFRKEMERKTGVTIIQDYMTKAEIDHKLY